MIKKQHGFFALVTAALIVIVGFLGTAIAYMFVGSATSGINFLQSSKAFYIADGGLEEATRYLSTPLLTGAAARIACGSVSGNANLTASSLGDGTFTVTATGPFYVSAPTTLNGALTASDTTIPVSSTSNYQSSGRIMIDQEFINYAAVDSTNFLGCTRGADGTTAAAHVTGTSVGQYQCNLSSAGGIPSVASANQKRTLQQQVQLQQAWAVGNNSGGNFRTARFNAASSELTWSDNSFASGSDAALNSISMSSFVDGWAVGASARFLHWDGNAWALTTVSPNATYNGVACISKNNCHAVGNAQSSAQLILDWNGSTWTRATPGGTTGNLDLNSISCPASNNCWAVGNRASAVKIFYSWNGTSWTGTNVAATFANAEFPFLGVSCGSTSDCWAVGADNVFAHYTGGVWVAVASGMPNVQYRGIFCNNASDCWAVGNNSSGDLFIRWNGSSWSRSGPSASIPNVNFNSVTCAKTISGSSKDCWAVGVNSGGDNFAHWDGTSWERVGPSASIADVNFNGITMINPMSQPTSAWAENFP